MRRLVVWGPQQQFATFYTSLILPKSSVGALPLAQLLCFAFSSVSFQDLRTPEFCPQIPCFPYIYDFLVT